MAECAPFIDKNFMVFKDHVKTSCFFVLYLNANVIQFPHIDFSGKAIVIADFHNLWFDFIVLNHIVLKLES